MSYSFSFKDDRSIVRGLVPVRFQSDLAARRYQLAGNQYDDYVWFEFRRADGLAPGAVLQAIADTLTSVLQDMRNLEVPQEMALKSLGLRVVIVRGLHEAPREVDLMTTFAAASTSTNPNTNTNPQQLDQQQHQIQVQNNARLADWVQWGILQKDPSKFRFDVYPITPASNPSTQGLWK